MATFSFGKMSANVYQSWQILLTCSSKTLSIVCFLNFFTESLVWNGANMRMRFSWFPDGIPEFQMYIRLVRLEKCCRMSCYSRKCVLIQPRTSPPHVVTNKYCQKCARTFSTKLLYLHHGAPAHARC